MIDCAGEMVKYGWKSLFILILNNEKFSYIVNVRLSEIPTIKIYRRWKTATGAMTTNNNIYN